MCISVALSEAGPAAVPLPSLAEEGQPFVLLPVVAAATLVDCHPEEEEEEVVEEVTSDLPYRRCAYHQEVVVLPSQVSVRPILSWEARVMLLLSIAILKLLVDLMRLILLLHGLAIFIVVC